MPEEKTSKPVKAAQVFAWSFILASVASGFYVGTQEAMLCSAYGVALGICIYLLARFWAWWQYG